MTIAPAEDRLAINDLLVSFCGAADALGDPAAITGHFTEDAVYDLTGFGLQAFEGQAAIAGFFAASFAQAERNVHVLSNVAVADYAGDSASASAYVHAFSIGKDGSRMELRARYAVEVRRTDAGWKMSRMGISVLPV